MTPIFSSQDRIEECFVNVYREAPSYSRYGNLWKTRESASTAYDDFDPVDYRIHVIPKARP